VTELGPRFRVVQTLDHEEPPAALFLARVLDTPLREVRMEHWATSERSLAGLGEPLLRSAGDNGESLVVELNGTLAHVALRGGFVVAQVAAHAEDAARSALQSLRDRLPAPEPVARHDVPVAFWTYTPNGPMPSLRPIAVPEWDEIGENYAAATRSALDPIMGDFKPAHGGQLILWHGEAGTGKTFALRALAWEWRDWCQLHYIVDPDTFFGERADYLMGVLMQPPGMSMGIHVMGGGPHGWAMSRAIFHDEEMELVELLRRPADDRRGHSRAADRHDDAGRERDARPGRHADHRPLLAADRRAEAQHVDVHRDPRRRPGGRGCGHVRRRDEHRGLHAVGCARLRDDVHREAVLGPEGARRRPAHPARRLDVHDHVAEPDRDGEHAGRRRDRRAP
jgi:hypothetical protein